MDGLRHIIKTQDFDRKWLEDIFFKEVETFEKILEKNPDSLRTILKNKSILLLFWKPSRRTSTMFKLAAQKLGAETTLMEGAGTKNGQWELFYSSEVKGGNFEDIIVTFAVQGNDCVIIRHPHIGSAGKAVEAINEFNLDTTVINAGDGPGQHPVQALIDLYTIRKDFGHVDGLTGVLTGDLCHSRAIHSLAYLLGKFNVKIFLLSHPEMKIPEGITDYFKRHSVRYEEITPLQWKNNFAGKKNIDFFYVVRDDCPSCRTLIFEKHKTGKEAAEDIANHLPQIDLAFSEKFVGPQTKVYHPFSRGCEILSWKQALDEKLGQISLDKTPWAGYFGQLRNGIPVSMALLKMIMKPEIDIKRLEDNALYFYRHGLLK